MDLPFPLVEFSRVQTSFQHWCVRAEETKQFLAASPRTLPRLLQSFLASLQNQAKENRKKYRKEKNVKIIILFNLYMFARR